MDYISPAAGLLGVIVGGWLSPWLNHKMEKRKTKDKLKPELIRSLYVFCNYRKLALTKRNEYSLNLLLVKLMTAENLRIDIPEDRKQLNKENIMLLRSASDAALIDLNTVFKELVQEEANLLSLVTEIKKAYDEAKYNLVDNLVQPEIDKSNDTTDLFDYINMDYNGYKEMHPKFKNAIASARTQLDADFKRIANKIQGIL